MQRINLDPLINRVNQNLPPHNEQPPSARLSDPNHPLWELWERMGAAYGHQWASQQGDEPNDTWARGLAGLTNEQFSTGLQALLDRKDIWPPNLIEFRQLCTGHDPQAWERRCHKPYDPSHALERKRTPEENAQCSAIIKALKAGL